MTLDDFLKTFIHCTRLHLSFEIEGGGEETNVALSGEDAPILLQRNAEILHALDYLSNRMFERSGLKIRMDCNGYREVRAEELRLMALTAAENVKRLGKPFVFSPMLPEERRIVHLAVAEDSGVRTESQGLGEQRKVVIYPR